MDGTDNTRRCAGITAKGTRCEKVITTSQTYCYSHNPEAAQKRKENASKAAKARYGTPCDEIVELRQELRDLAEQIRERKVTPGIGSVVNQVLGTLLRTFEQERKQVEFDELRKEVEELKARFATRTLENDSAYGSGYWAR